MGMQTGCHIPVSQELIPHSYLFLELSGFPPSHFGVETGHLMGMSLKSIGTVLSPVVLKLVSIRIT